MSKQGQEIANKNKATIAFPKGCREREKIERRCTGFKEGGSQKKNT